MTGSEATAVASTNPLILLSELPAAVGQRRAALGTALLILTGFLAILPVARLPATPLPTFIVAQQALLAVADTITAVLLFGQYSIGRSRGLNILAGGYLFTGLIVIPHALSFPGAFSATGLLNAGAQGTAWLYLAWHAVLPSTIVAYALFPGRTGPEAVSVGIAPSITAAVLAAGGGVVLLALIATVGHESLPAVMAGNQFTAAARIAVGIVLGLNLVALLTLAMRRPRSILDVWLMVVMFAWMCAITLGSFISSGRFDVGWYAGRVFAALASLVVLIVLLTETIALYERTLRLAANERRERERRVREMETMLAHLARVDDLGQIVSSLIHEVNQPLAAINNYLSAGIHLADVSKEDRLKQVLERAAEQSTRASGIIRHLRDFIAGRESERQPNDVPDVLSDGVRLALVASGGEAPSLEIDCAPEAAVALFDRIQIEQVVFNLVRNAAEAMSGSVRRELSITARLNGDNMVELRIADTGTGLSPDARTKLFEPFVTTKASGLGVGLSICRFIVESHGGRLWAEDRPGGGTVFCFTLTKVDLRPAPSAAAVAVSND